MDAYFSLIEVVKIKVKIEIINHDFNDLQIVKISAYHFFIFDPSLLIYHS